ncbi:unnamed protein product, partial [Choristocarpus tenellus]
MGVKASAMQALKEHLDLCKTLGWNGPICSLQLDSITVSNTKFITFTASFIPSDWRKMQRLALCTRAFPGTHTAEDLKIWIEEVTMEFFSDFAGKSVKPKDIFLAGTVDQGTNLYNAVCALGIESTWCSVHRLNTAVVWGLGISGSNDKKSPKNGQMRETIKKITDMVAYF